MTVAQLPLPLAFILSNIPDYQHLADSLSAQADVHIIDANGDALAQMAAIAANYSELSAIHLYSHGAAGQIDLGGVTLNNTNVMQYSETLAQIGAALSETGDILLYGCHVAAGEAGAELIGKLAQVTNADIAASTDLTGAAALGGDWVLEATSGVIEAESIGAYGYDHSLVGYTWNMSASAITPSGNGGTPYQINTEISIGYNQPEVPSAPGTITAVWYDSTDGRELTTQTWTPAATGAQTHNFAYQPGPSDISTLDGDTVKVTFTVSSSNFSPATTATSDYTYSAANWAPPNSAPTAGNGGSVDIAVGNSLQSSDLNNSNTGSSDPDSDTLTYSITSGVTASANAALKGRMQVGTASYSINDGHDHTANGQVAVYATYADDPISWSTAASTFNTTWNTSGNNSLQLSGATDPDDGVAYSLVSVDGGLVPSWMSITSGGLISANTAPEHAGHTYTVVARASATGSVDKSFTITIGNAASVNDIPTISSNGSKTVAEDPTNALAFSASDFHFADLDNSAGGSTAMGAALASIRIDSLPMYGTLLSGGSEVVEGDEIAVEDISTLTYTPNENYSGSESFTYSVYDGIAWSASPATMNITVTPTNDAPVIDNSNEAVPTLTTHTENETTNAGNLVSDLVARTSVDNAKTAVSDVDTLNNSGAGNAPEAVGLGVAIYALADTSLTGTGAWEYSTNNGASWTAIGSVSATNALLLSASDKVRFVPDTNNAVDAYFDFYAWDYATGTHGTKVDVSARGNATAFSTGSDRANISITSVNDAPTLDLDASAGGTGYTGSYIVRGNGVKIADTDSSILDIDKMFDPDSEGTVTLPDTIASATVTISAGAIDNGFGEIFEQLTYPNPEMVYESWYANNITISGSGTDSITISGKGSWSDYQNIIEAITYKNTNPDAIPGDRSITVTITDSNLTAAGDALTATATATIANIWAPVVDTNGTAEGLNYTNTFTEGGNGVRIVAASAEIIDQDGNLSQVVVSISNVQNAGLETLTFSGGNGVWGSTGLTVSGSGTSSITISGNISPASYNQVLRSITYSNSSENPDTTARTITIAATDAESHTGVSETTGHTTISVVPVNDLPTSVGGSESIAEDGGVAGSLTFGAADFNFADLDATAGHTNDVGATLASIRIDTLTGHGTLKLDGTNVTVGDVIAVANIGNLTYTPNENYSGSDSFTYSLNDGYVGSDNNGWSTTSSTMSLTVVPENDAPVLVDTTATLTTIDENATTNSGNFVHELVTSSSRTDVDVLTNGNGEGSATGMAIYALSSTDADGTGSGTWQYSTNNGSTWTAIGTVTETQALLLSATDKVRFVPDTYNGSSVSFSYHIWDEATGTHGSKVDVSTRGGTTAFSTDSDTAALTVTSVNDAPTLDLDTTADGTGYTTTYRVREGQVSIVKQDVASVVKVAVGDVDQGSSISKLTVAIASGAYDNQNGTIYETLTIASGMLSDLIAAGASVTGNGTPSISIEIGTSTYAYEAILKSISYENANPNAYMGTRTVDIKVYDDTNVVSNTATTIINSVWAPVVDANGALANYTHTAASFTEGSATGVKVVAADASITDQDSLIKSMVISIADVDNEGFETLTIPDATVTALQNNGFTITGNGTAELTIAATNATLGKSTNLFQSALRTVEYKNTSGEIDGSSTRDITITVTDVNNNVGVVGHSTIDMIAVNSAPAFDTHITASTLTSISEDPTTNTGTTIATLIADDRIVDSDVTTAVKAIAVSAVDTTNGSWEYKVGSGTWAAFDFTGNNSGKGLLLDATDAVRFVPNSNYNGTATFTYSAWDKDTGTAGNYLTLDGNTGGTKTLSSTTDTATITITAVNDAPAFSSATATISIDENTVAVGNANASDVDNQSLTYTITGGSDSALFNIDSNTGALSFINAPNYEGVHGNSYAVTIQTSDGSLTASQDVTININDVNEAPTLVSPIDDVTQTGAGSVSVNTSTHFTDQDANTTLTYSAQLVSGEDLVVLPSWLSINSATGVISGNPPVGAESVIVRVTATDNANSALSTSDNFAITLSGSLNDTPTVPTFTTPFEDVGGTPTIDPAKTGAGDMGPVVVPAFGDGDGDTLTYSTSVVKVNGEPATGEAANLPSWLSFNATTRTFTGNPPAGAENTTYTVRVAVSDGHGGTTSQDIDLVFGSGLNDTPTVPTPLADPSSKTGDGAMTPVEVPAFGDADGDTLSYTATLTNGNPLPSWLSFDATTRTFTGNPPAGAENTTLDVRVTGTDGHGGEVSDDISLSFGSGLNDTPTVPTPLADPSSKSGSGAMTPVVVPVFGDADGDTLSYTATLTNGNPLPSWLSFNATTRTFTGNPPVGAENTTLDVRVTGTDGNGGSISDDISLSFGTGLNDTPTVPTPLADPSSKSGSGAMTPVVVPVFGDADGDTLSYSATLTNGNPLPSWLSFDATTRTFTGNPPAGAENTTVDVRVTGTDASGASVSDDISLSFGTGLNDTPTVPTPLADPSSKSGSGAMTPVVVPVFGDADGDTLSYSATLTNGNPLPSWLSFNATTRTFTGNPPAGAENTTVAVRVTGTDASGASVSDDISLSFGSNLNDAPTVATIPTQTPTLDESGRISVNVSESFSDPDGNSLTYSAILTTGSSLPSWLSVDPETGVLSGNPPLGTASPLSVVLTATDTSGATVSSIVAINLTGNLNTLSGLPSPAQAVVAGALTQLADFSITDELNSTRTFSVTLTPTNGVIYGLTDTDANTTGIQLTGTKAEVEALIAKATFIASAAGSASIAIAVNDGANTTTSTYSMVASAATHTDNREASSGQDPTTVTQVVIAPIDNVTTGQSSDYPLFWGEATKTAWATTANLPVGVGLVTSGSLAPSATQTTQSSIADLIALIDATASATEKGSMESGGQAFLNALDLVDTLVVSKLTLTSSSGASAGSVHVSGTTNDVLNAVNGTQAPTEALVVDGSALPTGSILFLDNIDFASIVGDGLTIRGGDGENVVFTGEGRQNIQLGAGDDELHAGAGNDWVGSQSGNDLIFGDAGNDFIYGGAGDDTLDGGTGMDTAVYAGNRTDYTLTKVSQTQWTVSSAAEGTDTLLNVEFVQFADQSLTLVGNNQWLNQVAQSAVLFF